VLCFVEVKTRTSHSFKPAEAAVDRDKQRELSLVPRDFLCAMPLSCQRGPHPVGVSPHGVEWRFDVLAVYYERGRPAFELFQNAFPVAYNRGFANSR
jgi:Holliday junction resolvase-like predicted endonuclease